MKQTKNMFVLLVMLLMLVPPILMAGEHQGTVKFFNNAKKYGFITPEGGGKVIFVHATGLIDQI